MPNQPISDRHSLVASNQAPSVLISGTRCPAVRTTLPEEDWVFLAPGLAHNVLKRILSITPTAAVRRQARRMIGVEPNGTIRRYSVKMFSESGPTCSRPWLLSTVCLLLLTGCVTTRLAEEDRPHEAEALDIGYGEIDEGHMAGSVSTVYDVDTQVTHSRTMLEMLARLPGVRVKESHPGELSVSVRGAAPLYVVDGMIFHGSLRSINPNTVKSISVLKNAGETAIYGSQVGHGGVILIRTKEGSD